MRIVLLLALLLPLPVPANEGCALLWDISLVSRAMAEEGAPHGMIAGVLRRVYPYVASPVLAHIATLSLAGQGTAQDYAMQRRLECDGAKPDKTPMFHMKPLRWTLTTSLFSLT